MDTTEQILKYCPKSGPPNILRQKSLLRSLQSRPRWVMLSGGTFDFHFVTPGWSPQADQIFSYVTHVFCSFSVFSPPQLYGAIDSIALMPSSTALVQSLSCFHAPYQYRSDPPLDVAFHLPIHRRRLRRASFAPRNSPTRSLFDSISLVTAGLAGLTAVGGRHFRLLIRCAAPHYR